MNFTDINKSWCATPSRHIVKALGDMYSFRNAKYLLCILCTLLMLVYSWDSVMTYK